MVVNQKDLSSFDLRFKKGGKKSEKKKEKKEQKRKK